MQIQVPDERAFYYECTGRDNRLLCWIPPDELKALVENKKAKKAILRDYPDGLDLKVANLDISFHWKFYGFDPGLDSAFTNAAFWALRLKNLNYRGAGFINYGFLTDLAKHISEKSPPIVKQWIVQSEVSEITGKDRSRYAQLEEVRLKVLKFLSGFDIPPLDVKRQLWPRLKEVRMKEGKDPSRVFSDIKKRRERK